MNLYPYIEKYRHQEFNKNSVFGEILSGISKCSGKLKHETNESRPRTGGALEVPGM